jgi:uncharacterized phage-associated protein
MPYTPLAVANSFIIQHGADGGGIEHMKLQKLLFFAYGWWLVRHDSPLLGAKPEVWRYGPVFSSVYWHFNRFGDQPIPEPLPANPFSSEIPKVPISDAETVLAIQKIWENYGGFDSFALSDMTHKVGTPWQRVAAEHNYRVPQNLEIDDAITKSYFSRLERTGALF